MATSDVFQDAERLYSEALARLQVVRDEWNAEGQPLLAGGSNGQLIEHPLVKMQREHERLVADLGERLAKKRRGPEPKAVLGGGTVKRAGSAKLRAVKKTA